MSLQSRLFLVLTVTCILRWLSVLAQKSVFAITAASRAKGDDTHPAQPKGNDAHLAWSLLSLCEQVPFHCSGCAFGGDIRSVEKVLHFYSHLSPHLFKPL